MVDPMNDVDARTYQDPEAEPQRNRWAYAIWPLIAIGVVATRERAPFSG